VEHHTWDRVR